MRFECEVIFARALSIFDEMAFVSASFPLAASYDILEAVIDLSELT
ncbi:MAG: hypothetical protein J7K30_15555 [Deltaproteobacteria bacterium]|nr:hypothetical protein [Deltaproteobacteria bacterium]